MPGSPSALTRRRARRLARRAAGAPHRALIVDDEPLSRERLRLLAGRCPGLEVVGECAGGVEAVLAIEAERPDLVFLDVQMPEVDGFDVIRTVGPAAMPAVVFVTAYDRHALRAFEVHALDYLLKPVAPERFEEAVARALRRRRPRRAAADPRVEGLLADAPARRWPARLAVPTRGGTRFVAVRDVDWVEAAGNYVRLHVGGERLLLRRTLTALEAQLDPARFARIHRSVIVNRGRVRERRTLESGSHEVVLQSGERLPMSRRYRTRLDPPPVA